VITPLRPETAQPRAPLSNTDAEQALLGALLFDNAAYGQVSEFLRAEHFDNAVHRRIYAAIGALVERGEVANPITLKGQFDQDSALSDLGGARYLLTLAKSALVISNTEHYGRHILDLYLRRQMVAELEETIEDIYKVDLDRQALAIVADHGARLESVARIANAPKTINIDLLRGQKWLDREIGEPDFLLGEFLSTTTRAEMIGPTGLGKTNLLVALGLAVADGQDFLHWRGGGNPRRVLYVDGEMSRRLSRRRLIDAARRHGGMPPTLFFLNREDFPDLKPLNTEAGQKFIDGVIIDAIGGADLVIFDNIQALLTGDMREEEPWQQTLPWVRHLTQRNIGQIWAHHTGHDETHGYGTKTREWQLDTVLLMEEIERPEADIAFGLKFTKARERTPDNRADFAPAVITLAGDRWASERGEHLRGRKAKAKDRALELLQDAIAREGSIPPASEHIPPETACVTEGQWRRYCDKGCISDGNSEDALRMAFKRAAKKLIGTGKVGKWDLWVWVVP
jgi:hypothetical protein